MKTPQSERQVAWAGYWTGLIHGIAIGAVLILALAGLVGPAHAADVTPQQAHDIFAVAYGQFHGPRTLLDDQPQIHIASQDELHKKLNCGEHCPTIHGLYDEGNGEIYVYEGLDFSTVYATTVLLHEYIHHFQVKTRGRVMDLNLSGTDLCLEVVAREHEAYRIQWQVLLNAREYRLAQTVHRAAGQYGCRKAETLP